MRAALEVAVMWGWIEMPVATLDTIDRVAAMTWRLSHPRTPELRAAPAAPRSRTTTVIGPTAAAGGLVTGW